MSADPARAIMRV